MAKDGIGAGPVGRFAGSVFNIPSGNESGLLAEVRDPLLLEDGVGLAAPGYVGGHAAQVSGNSSAVIDGDAAAFDPEGPALGE